jgi:hypothetical protein
VEYERFRQNANKWLPYQLPEHKLKWSPFGRHGGIIYFKPDWTPHLRVNSRPHGSVKPSGTVFATPLKIGLRPVYEQLGVKWKKPPVQFMQVLYLLVLFLLVVLVAYCSNSVFKNFIDLWN